MKRKILIILLSIMSAVCLCIGFAACDLFTNTTNLTDEHTHTLTHYEENAATETTDGNTEYWYCSGCGKYFSDSNGKTEISQSETVIPATGTGSTDSGSSGSGGSSTEGGSTEGGSTEGGSTEGGSTEGGSTEGGSTEGGSTEGGSTETTFAYADKTFDLYSGEITFYLNGTTVSGGMSDELSADGFTVSFTVIFNSDGTGECCQGITYNGIEINAVTISFNYTITECTSLAVNYDDGAVQYSGSVEFYGYKLVVSNCKYIQYIYNLEDSLSTRTDEQAATDMSMLAFGYNDSGLYIYGIEGFSATDTDTDIYIVYGKLADISGGSTEGGSTEGGSTEGGSTEGGSTEGGSTEGGSGDSGSTHTHSLTYIEPLSATCGAEGNIGYWYCSDCKKYFSDSEATTEIELADTVIEATGKHVPITTAVTENLVEATCGTAGSYDSVIYCSVCSVEISRETVTIPSTGEHSYNAEGICTVCGMKESSKGLEFTLSDDKTYYTVSGIGECTDTDIIIPSTHNELSVTAISASAFSGQTQIISIYVPDSVTSIGSGAFAGCSSLVSITLPFVGGSANATSASSSTLFGYIFGTSSYTGGTSTKQYYKSGSYSTYYIPTTLTTVTITGGNILYGAFYSCISLESVTIGSGVTSIGNHAFYDCSLTSVYYGGTASQWASISFGDTTANPLSYAGNLYLNGSLATDITLEGITSIKAYAFNDCKSLKSVTIPEAVTSIGNYAFNNCTSLTSVTIGSGITYIGTRAFSNCTALTEINFNATAMDGLSSSNYVFYCAGQEGDGITVTIGANVTKIPSYLFSPYSGNSSGSYAPNITSIVFEDNSVCTSIGSYAFYYCNSITSITIPDGVTSIGSYAFDGCSIASITIPDSVTSIGSYAFAWCTSLTSVTIGSGVTSIGTYAFEYCTALTELNFNVKAMNDLSSSNYVFYNAGQSGDGITVTIGANVTKIPAYLFYPYYVSGFDVSPKITSVVFEDNSVCASIGSRAFYYCISLASITIPNSVTTIGDYVFYNCTGLESVTIGSGATSIGSSAFYGCTSLASITIGSGVTSIGSSAFRDCKSLTSVTV